MDWSPDLHRGSVKALTGTRADGLAVFVRDKRLNPPGGKHQDGTGNTGRQHT